MRDNNVLSRNLNGQDNFYPIVSDNNLQLENVLLYSNQHTWTPAYCVAAATQSTTQNYSMRTRRWRGRTAPGCWLEMWPRSSSAKPKRRSVCHCSQKLQCAVNFIHFTDEEHNCRVTWGFMTKVLYHVYTSVHICMLPPSVCSCTWSHFLAVIIPLFFFKSIGFYNGWFRACCSFLCTPTTHIHALTYFFLRCII